MTQTILDAFKLDGRVALVTGGGRGLGRGFSLALAEAGADVVVVDRSGSPETRQTVADVESLGRRAWSLQLDLLEATPQDVRDLVDDAVAAAGRLDVLVNNAGIIRREPAIEHSETSWADAGT